jgi:hypothetical protein
MKLSPEDEAGVQAIIYLQGLAGIKETETSALHGWRQLSVDHRRRTMAAYRLMLNAFQPKGGDQPQSFAA